MSPGDDASQRGDEPDRALPGGLDRPIDLDLAGRHNHPVIRRACLAAFALIVIAAIANAFGQEPQLSTASGDGAELSLKAPDRLRGGLIFATRFDIEAGATGISNPRLELAAGWLDGFTANTLEPTPANETANGGRLQLTYPAIDAGDSLTIWMQWQTNPTTIGSFDAGTRLFDGDRLVAELDRTVTVFP